MRMVNKIHVLVLLAVALMISVPDLAMSQADSCAYYLKDANKNYEGRYYDAAIEEINKALSKCSLNKEDKVKAHKILALSYLGIDDLEAASDEARRIMKIDPAYEPDKFEDDPDYTALFEKFVSTPVLRLGVNAGVNKPGISVSEYYSIYHGPDAADFSEYDEEIGFQLGLTAEYLVFKNLWINSGMQFRTTNYSHFLYEIEGNKVDYQEKLSYFELPIAVKYTFLKGDLRPYVTVGGYVTYLTNAISTSQRADIDDIVDRIDYRNTFYAGFGGGAGVTYHRKGFDLFLDVRYTTYPEQVNKDGTRYADEVNVYQYYYIDNDFSMDILQVNAGIMFNLIYRNRELK
jgi:tetratricopeptide (TPR) repeat protein